MFVYGTKDLFLAIYIGVILISYLAYIIYVIIHDGRNKK